MDLKEKLAGDLAGLSKGIRTVIVGTNHLDRDAINAVVGLLKGDTVELRRDADNEYDDNAVAVYFRGRQIGFIPRAANPLIAERLDADDTLQITGEVYEPAFYSVGKIRRTPKIAITMPERETQ